MGLLHMISISLALLYLSPERTSAIQTFYLNSSCQYQTRIIKVGDVYSGSNSSGVLKTFSMNWYSPRTECVVRLVSKDRSEGINVSIRKVDFYSCSYSLELKDSVGITNTYCSDVSDDLETENFFSYGDITVTFRTGYFGFQSYYEGFEITFTSYRATYTGGNYCPPSSAYRCDNGRCISDALLCDGHNHCGDRSDQSCGLTKGGIVGVVIGVIVLIALISGSIHCCRKRHTIIGTTIVHHPPPPQQPIVSVYPSVQQYLPPGIQHPQPGMQHLQPGMQHPQPGMQHPPPGNYPSSYWTSAAQDGGHQNPVYK